MAQQVVERAPQRSQLANGPAAAALLAGGIGAAALGVFIVLAEAVPAVKTWLTWTAPVGPLSGKTAMAVLVWLVSWGGCTWACAGGRWPSAAFCWQPTSWWVSA